jgi:hypothetical protein
VRKQEYTRTYPSVDSEVFGAKSFVGPFSLAEEATTSARRLKDALSSPGGKKFWVLHHLAQSLLRFDDDELLFGLPRPEEDLGEDIGGVEMRGMVRSAGSGRRSS